MRQIKLQDTCEQIVDDTDGALGCALVDLSTGLPLALDVEPGSILSADAMELISAAGAEYFRDNQQHIAGADETGDDMGSSADLVEEVQATTEQTYNFMALIPGAEHELLILVTDRKRSNLGLGWMALRHGLERVRNTIGNDAPGQVRPSSAVAMDAPVRSRQPTRPTSEIPGSGARGRRTIWGQR